jgi:hypothetical protein
MAMRKQGTVVMATAERNTKPTYDRTIVNRAEGKTQKLGLEESTWQKYFPLDGMKSQFYGGDWIYMAWNGVQWQWDFLD